MSLLNFEIDNCRSIIFFILMLHTLHAAYFTTQSESYKGEITIRRKLHAQESLNNSITGYCTFMSKGKKLRDRTILPTQYFPPWVGKKKRGWPHQTYRVVYIFHETYSDWARWHCSVRMTSELNDTFRTSDWLPNHTFLQWVKHKALGPNMANSAILF